ncbi:MAG TPA: serine/threonine-protein kinase [Polyangiaceae bacterium]|nr:serine/threonine-protein kinase [Polyangiaceae bacterium]
MTRSRAGETLTFDVSVQSAAEGPSRTTFGKYQLIAALGSGGMADVFLAVARGPARFNKLVVLKCLRKRWLEDEHADDARSEKSELIEMFLEEARLAARLNHPNIVQTNEVGDESGDYFIAMEYLEGQSFNRVVNRAARTGRDIPIEASVAMIAEVLSGLHHAHEFKDYDGAPLEIVHRDATPHNIFITYDGQTKLVDFGIAKAATRTFETRTGILKGKIQYMAPEQARCHDVDRRADIFSIGVLLWELVAKKRMWQGQTDIQILQSLVSEPVPSLREVAPDAPAALVAVVDKATAFDVSQRYATAEAMRLDLLEVAKTLPPTSHKAMGDLTAELFADKRARVKQIIENQFTQIRLGEEIDLNVMEPQSTISGSKPTASSDLSEGSHPSRSSVRREPTLAASMGSDALEAPKPKRTALVVGAGIVATAAIAIAVTFSRPSGPTAPATASAVEVSVATATTAAQTGAPTATTTGPATTTAADQGRLTKLLVSATPATAKIYIDDIEVPGNPYSGSFPRDAANHRIRVEADGFVGDKRLVTFDEPAKDIVVELAEKAAAGPRPLTRGAATTTAASAAPAPSAAATSGSTGPGKPPKRQLDPNNPYAPKP